jgi:hypothetical protein
VAQYYLRRINDKHPTVSTMRTKTLVNLPHRLPHHSPHSHPTALPSVAIVHTKALKAISLAISMVFALSSCVTPPAATKPTVAAKPSPAASPTTSPAAAAAASANVLAAMSAAASAAPGDPRKYDDVITKDAKTARGMLLYHKVKERHYFEIPEKLLGRDLLWSAEISQASTGGGFNGLPLGYRVVRFERVDNRILLRSVSYQNRGINDLKAASEAVDLAPIVMAFPVESEGNERSVELRAEEKRLIEKEKTEKADKEKAEKAKAQKEKTDKEKTDKETPSGSEATPPETAKIAANQSDTKDIAATVARAQETLAAKLDAADIAKTAKPEMTTPIKADAKPEAKVATATLEKADTKADVKTDAKANTKENSKEKASADAKPEAKAEPKLPPPKEKWPVIEVTRLLLTTSNDLIDGRNVGSMGFGAVDPSRSLIGQVKVFETNVEVRSTVTFASVPMPIMMPGMPAPPSVSRNPSKTAVLHYSVALLPETPMQGRYADERVGYFTEPFLEFGGEHTGVRKRDFITRFRLEKKDPTLAVSEVKKPITLYIAREVPEKWRKPLIAGIEDWQPVFEAAGYKNAIIAKLAPTKEEDPRWDAEDARHSVIRWVAMPIANAMGPNVHDPRSGEIISAHVIFWHDLLSMLEQGYFVQAGAADSRVDKLPLSDEIMSQLIRNAATHEIGHTLGLRHNHRAATAYSVKDLRNPEFTAANGTSASVMSYARYNSVAQPGDGVKSFIPKIGPYDYFAIEWGYKALGKATSDEERPLLDKMAARQIDEPLLKFGGEDTAAFFDPEVQTENIGRERIEATRLSITSLERAAARLIGSTTKLGEDYEQLDAMYRTLLGQRSSYIASVVKLIGGVRETRYLGGRGGDTFVRTTPKEQQAAIRYLLDEALITPKWLIDPQVLNRIVMIDVTAPVVNSQKRILGDMLSPARFRVLEDAESLSPGTGLTAADYLSTVQKSVFREASQANPRVDIYRRELQREFIEHLKTFSGEAQRFKSFGMMISAALTELTIDLRPAAMQGLKELKHDMDIAERRATDKPTRLHFAQLSREIEKTLKVRGN